MSIRKLIGMAVLLLSLTVVGCGSNGSTSEEQATLSGSVTAGSAAAYLSDNRAAAVPAGLQVFAVDESGRATDLSPVNSDGGFSINVPTGHDYVVVFSDDSGIVAAMLYGANRDSVFSVPAGTGSLDLGTVEIDQSGRNAVTARELPSPEGSYLDDWDADAIPDSFDADDDNDGIDDAVDISIADHDNDGITDDLDIDDDNDGISDDQDSHPHDQDNNGVDDDREEGEGQDGNSAEGHDNDGGGYSGGGDAALGESLFLTNCAGCHGGDTVDGEGPAGSSLDEIREVLQEGEDDMPSFPELVGNAEDIYAYLHGSSTSGTTTTTVGSTTTTTVVSGSGGPDAALGASLYQGASCASCHGSDGSGPINIRGASTSRVSNVLQNGKGSMPSYPELVGNAADIQAFLNQ